MKLFKEAITFFLLSMIDEVKDRTQSPYWPIDCLYNGGGTVVRNARFLTGQRFGEQFAVEGFEL